MRWRRKPLLILSIWSRPSCRGAGATSGITRPERCARSSTAKVERGSAQIIQQSGSAILPICPAVDERVGRGLATPTACWPPISRSWREISYSRTWISNLGPLAGWISALERGRFQGHKQKRKLKSVAPFARNRKFESSSLQRRVSDASLSAELFATRQVGLRSLWRRDRRAAAQGLAPQDVKARGDNDRGTDKRARGRHVPPHCEAENRCPYQREILKRHHCRGRRQ